MSCPYSPSAMSTPSPRGVSDLRRHFYGHFNVTLFELAMAHLQQTLPDLAAAPPLRSYRDCCEHRGNQLNAPRRAWVSHLSRSRR
jgi:hypothetical protein